MAEFKVFGSKIELLEHPQADKLMIAKVGNYSLVVGKSNGYNEGDIVFFAPEKSVLPDEIKENYSNQETGVSYLKGTERNRVGRIRLRGEYSDGVTLNRDWVLQKGGWSSLDEVPLNEDLSELLGIQKYEVPIPVSLSGEVEKIEGVQFQRHHDVEQFRLYSREFQPGEMVYATEKLHGCFSGKTSLFLPDGKRIQFSKLVKEKKFDYVMGIDNNGIIRPVKILNYFKNGLEKNWLKIQYSREKMDKGISFQSVQCTLNHEFWNPKLNDYVKSVDLKIDDEVLMIRNKLHLSYFHEQILIGSMLGDASWQKDFRRMTFSQKKEHEDYLDFKLKCLSNIALEKGKEQISGYGTTMCRATTKSLMHYDYFDSWIKNEKQVPKTIIGKLSPISLAFWYMEDGSLSHDEGQEDRAQFATCGFNEKSINNLLKALNLMGIVATKKITEEKYWRIYLNSDEADKLFILIKPYITKCMQYKLPKYYRTGIEPDVLESNSLYKKETKISKILSIEKIISNEQKYDLETETNNYFAGGILVHNSQISVMKTTKNKWIITSKGIGKRELAIKESESNLYWQAFRNSNIAPFIASNFADREVQFFGEVLPAQKGFTYGQEKPKIYIFRMMVNNTELEWHEIEQSFGGFLLPHLVPTLYKGPYNEEKLIELSKGKETVSGKNLHVKEGIVVRPQNNRRSKEGFPLFLKIINPAYKETGEEFS